jgi:hypothetical protein
VKKQLSLRVNTNLDLSLELLRRHHGCECWVNTQLEAVWRLMAATSPPQLMVFELWYGDEMIAADFAHPTNGGRTVYVATRFFNRGDDVRQIQPGFVLAFAECKYLRDRGCRIWDLGGINLNPLMRYKLDLAGEPFERPVALGEFFASRRLDDTLDIGMMNIRSNATIVENLTFDDLIS